MRRFEMIADGSEKFWEIEASGAQVTVHFGRIGTNGQTKTKDHGSDDRATAEVARLIAEKLRKGYGEVGAAAPAAVEPRPPSAPRRRLKAAPVLDEPVKESEVDEDTWAVPDAWLRNLAPFRSRTASRLVTVDAKAIARVAAVTNQLAPKVEAAVANPRSDPRMVAAVRHGSEPLGAAVVGAAQVCLAGWGTYEKLGAIADGWCRDHGTAFAAEAAALLPTIGVVDPHRPNYLFASANSEIAVMANPGRAPFAYPVLLRMRALLAAANDAEYDEAIRGLERVRSSPVQRLASSYLVPTRADWVRDDLAMVAATPSGAGEDWLFASLTTAAEVSALITAAGPWALCRTGTLIFSVAAHVGPPVAPILASLFDQIDAADHRKRLVALLAQFPSDEAFDVLVARLATKYVQPGVVEAMGRFPRRAARRLAHAAATGDARAAELLGFHARSEPDAVAAVRDSLDPAAVAVIDRLTDVAPLVPDAAAERLPSVLVSPPWAEKRVHRSPPVVEGLRSAAPLSLQWLPGEQQRWAATETPYASLAGTKDWPALLADHANTHWYRLHVMAYAPVDLVLPYLARLKNVGWYENISASRRLLGRVGEPAIAVVWDVATQASGGGTLLAPIEGPEAAATMAGWFRRSKPRRSLAASWLDRHARGAARDLVPLALSKPGRERWDAEAALLYIARDDDRAVLDAALAYGPSAAQGIKEILSADPLERLPAKMPSLPGWLDVAHLPQVLLTDRQTAVPEVALGNVLTMLAISKPDETYAGVAAVQSAVDAASLAAMGWALFERWRGSGYQAKDAWVLDALAVIGDDETVRRLAPLIRSWPGEAAHKRAVTGLEVLSAIGSDVALLHLHGISQKVKFKGLRSAAQAKIQEVADGLGLTAEQLADRLVPDFGLDPDGTLELDYGSRRFRVGFDENLSPTVSDEDGTRRKLLPKPGAKDDADLGAAAYARFAALKKDVRGIATDQIRRFEQAMVNGRQWTGDEMRSLFVDHPLLWHISRRLVWSVVEDGAVSRSFRVAEDRTYADADDNETIVPGDASIVIPHPLLLGEQVTVWSDLFADYEILQPFAQLGRDVHALTPQERAATTIERYAGRVVGTGNVLGLSHRGWERGMALDAGIQAVTYKPVTDGRYVVVELDPGIVAGDAMYWKEQTLRSVSLSATVPDYTWTSGIRFDVLDLVAASELIRDLDHLCS